MAATVLRNGEGHEITHVYYTTFNARYLYLTKADSERMLEFSSKDVAMYYSGDDSEELESVKEDLAQIHTGDIPLEVIKLNIAKSTGIIQDVIIEM